MHDDNRPTVLSYGGGVNSTAILALCKLGKLPWPDYIVFSDTGAEWPHTYKYLEYIDAELEKDGQFLTYLTGGFLPQKHDYGFMTLIEFCQLKRFIPSRMNRWCTDYWKRTPVQKFTRAVDGHEWIGIDAGEARRAENKPTKRFPLIELGINRERCKEIIKSVGWGVPKKSGCFICPYQGKSQWAELKREYPDLWKIAVDLEKKSMSEHAGFTFKYEKSIEQYIGDSDKQENLPFGKVLDQKCDCYFD